MRESGRCAFLFELTVAGRGQAKRTQQTAAAVENRPMTASYRWQYRSAMKLTWLLVVAAVGCTRPNPAVCCLDPADCKEVGISEVRGCNAGLACVEHQCVVPSCAMAGCEATAPVCNVTTDVCEGCADSSECDRFAGPGCPTGARAAAAGQALKAAEPRLRTELLATCFGPIRPAGQLLWNHSW